MCSVRKRDIDTWKTSDTLIGLIRAHEKQKFPDGVWFIELGHGAKVQMLLDQFAEIVSDAFLDFLDKFTHLAAKDNTYGVRHYSLTACVHVSNGAVA